MCHCSPEGKINIPQTKQSNRLSTLSHWLISFWWQLTPLRNAQPVVENELSDCHIWSQTPLKSIRTEEFLLIYWAQKAFIWRVQSLCSSLWFQLQLNPALFQTLFTLCAHQKLISLFLITWFLNARLFEISSLQFSSGHVRFSRF